MGSMADAALGLIASHKNAWMANALLDPNITAKPAGSPNNAPLRAAKPSAGPPTQRASNAWRKLIAESAISADPARPRPLYALKAIPDLVLIHPARAYAALMILIV